jgi:hypothetical protein
MDSVTSRDGTLIAYERAGQGPAVILVGGGLLDPANFFHDAGNAVAAAVPHAERRTIEIQGHVADPKVLAPILKGFFTA